MRITVSGLPGSGTTSLSRYLAELLGFSMISAGRSLPPACKRAQHGTGGIWSNLHEENPSFDKMIDARQKEIAGSETISLSKAGLSGWMVEEADLKIWLYAPIGCRINRIVFRDQVV
jgi:cytidylate kinase